MGRGLAIFWMMVAVNLAWAEDPEPVVTAESPPVSAPKPKKGRPSREKETEGTEAKDRFQADTVIKSQYQLNGQTLEADPD